MSVKETRHETEHRIELPEAVVEAVIADIKRVDEPTVADVRDRAFGRVDRHTEFVTDSGERLVDVVAERIDE